MRNKETKEYNERRGAKWMGILTKKRARLVIAIGAKKNGKLEMLTDPNASPETIENALLEMYQSVKLTKAAKRNKN